MKQRVYIDTSVIEGYFDKEFAENTIPFFDCVIKGEKIIIVSDLLKAELLRAPEFVTDLLDSTPAENIEYVKLSGEASKLADKYIEAKVVGRTSRADCQHSDSNALQSRCFS